MTKDTKLRQLFLLKFLWFQVLFVFHGCDFSSTAHSKHPRLLFVARYSTLPQDMQFTYDVTVGRFLLTFLFFRGKAIYITYYERVCSLSFQHAMRMRHTVICGLSCSTVFFHIIP